MAENFRVYSTESTIFVLRNNYFFGVHTSVAQLSVRSDDQRLTVGTGEGGNLNTTAPHACYDMFECLTVITMN